MQHSCVEFSFQVHAPGCPVIIVGTHLDQVNAKSTGGLEKLIDQLYGDSTMYPIIAAITFVSSTTRKLQLNSVCNQLRKQIYYVAIHLFLDKGRSKLSTILLLDDNKCVHCIYSGVPAKQVIERS